ncbi:hypothetical protein PL75_10830, partial [Neisseria arctica]
NEQKVVLTPEQIAAGKVEVTLPAPQDGGKIEVSATVTDVAGNTGPAGTDSATVDTTVYKGLVIEITEDANNDGYINAAELKGNDIDVRVTLPEGAAAGDTLTVSGSGNTDKVITLTPEQVKAGYVDVKFNPTGDNTDFVATASIRDVAGNSAGPVNDSARLQLSAPGKPIVTITEDANNDGFINGKELNGDIGVNVALPATAVAGDTLNVDTNGDG